MTKTLNVAIEALKNGSEDAAWIIAQCDEGLDRSVTKADWLAFARGVIARREVDAKAHESVRCD